MEWEEGGRKGDVIIIIMRSQQLPEVQWQVADDGEDDGEGDGVDEGEDGYVILLRWIWKKRKAGRASLLPNLILSWNYN